MVKLYLKNKDTSGKKIYIDVSIWSFLKVDVLAGLLLAGLFYGCLLTLVVLYFLIGLLI